MTILTKPIRAKCAKLKLRDNVFESDRLQAWHHRQNIVHRFANGVQIEIKLNPKKP